MSIRIENLILSRGHIILWLEKNEGASEEVNPEDVYPKFLYISGELTMNGRFYPDLFREWYWVEKPTKTVYFLDNLTILGTVRNDEKPQIIEAMNERNKADEKNVQITFEPEELARLEEVCRKTSGWQESKSSGQQESEDIIWSDENREEEFFYGISRFFSIQNEDQYRTIGAFWDEMSSKYGLENLRGLGYLWTGDSMSYAIGLKEGIIEDYDVEIPIPAGEWKRVKGKTSKLPQIYNRIYEDGKLTFEIEEFTSDGECEISFYRIGDAWLDGELEVKRIVFDTALCSTYIRPMKPDPTVLISNFMYTDDSSIHWIDESSYGMCTHFCTKEEMNELYYILKDTSLEQWHFMGDLKYITVTAEIVQKALDTWRQAVLDLHE